MNPALDRAFRRRGVLMLVVVSMLTLFLMLGTTYLVVAVRARQASRAQARLAMEAAVAKPSSLLDAVLLKVVRGNADGVSAPLLAGTSIVIDFESLLADRYGPGVTATASGLVQPPGTPFITGTLTTGTAAGLESPSDLPGRVVTLLGSGREPTSHRILRAMPAGGPNISAQVVLDCPPRRRPFTLSGTLSAVVNGLDFDGSAGNEPYDAFDSANSFLTHLQPADASISASPEVAQSVASRASYVPSITGSAARSLLASSLNGLARGADNDNDGTPDGFFLDFGLPSVAAGDGAGSIKFDASVLVVDLDSRFNVNAHGSMMPSVYPRGCVGWPQPQGGETIPTVANAPLGSGYGPAEVNASWMFPKSSYPAELSRRMRGEFENPDSDVDANDGNEPLPPSAVQPGPFLLSGAAAPTQEIQKRPKTSRFSAGVNLPNMGDVEGRYGDGATRIASAATALARSGTNLATFTPLGSLSFPLARPGISAANDTLSLFQDSRVTPGPNNTPPGRTDPWWNGLPGFNFITDGGSLRATFNSPPDLHGRMLTTTATAAAIVPRLMFSAPEWGKETTDDPYEVRLDPKAARTGAAISAGEKWDNIYGYAELEALLRQYDRDGQQLPKRLLAVLGPAGEEARLRVTTDSWDTTMVTGTAARKIRQFVRGAVGTVTGTNAVTGLINNELARGERLNLNRRLTAAKPAVYDAGDPYFVQRQALFKDLFTLLVALGEPANEETAQWAANVVEFQDADSTMTPFEYDNQCGTAPYEWKVDGDITTAIGETGRRAVVWGAERPEVVIHDAFAWPKSPDSSGGIALSLHRPWNATAMSRVSGTNYQIFGEPCDYRLDTITGGKPTNVIDLGKKPGGTYDDVSSETLPIWRIRISSAGANQYIRLDSGSAAPGTTYVISPQLTDGAAKPKLAADGTLAILSGTTVVVGVTPTTGTATIQTGTTAFVVPNVQIAASGTITAYLERLSDLTFPLTLSGTVPGELLSGDPVTGSNVWTADATVLGSRSDTKATVRYIAVDQCAMKVNSPNALEITPSIRSSDSAQHAFWALPAAGPAIALNPSTAITISFPRAISGSNAAWFVWPNRPFVSPAELFLVPNGAAGEMLATYQKPTAADNDLLTLTGTNTRLLLDSVHVPTRFAGIHTTFNTSGTAALAGGGIFTDVTPVNQISSYREPGRVNLNTVTSDDVWNAVVAGPLQVSGSAKPVVVSGTAGANFAAIPAKSMLDILSLSSSGTAPRGDTYVGNPAMAAAKDRNPLHELYTATRLANTATTRSNVFAIWITVRESTDGDPDTVKLHRGFYIVDRSIPVAHEPGKDHNVWDCVVLRRIIE